MRKTIRINNWGIVGIPSGYAASMHLAPEQIPLKARLEGNIVDHPRMGKGVTTATTSDIVRVDNGYVETKSGSYYQLGDMHWDYRQFLMKLYPNWDGVEIPQQIMGKYND